MVFSHPSEKYAQVKLDHETPNRGENKKYLKPPPRLFFETTLQSSFLFDAQHGTKSPKSRAAPRSSLRKTTDLSPLRIPSCWLGSSHLQHIFTVKLDHETPGIGVKIPKMFELPPPRHCFADTKEATRNK